MGYDLNDPAYARIPGYPTRIGLWDAGGTVGLAWRSGQGTSAHPLKFTSARLAPDGAVLNIGSVEFPMEEPSYPRHLGATHAHMGWRRGYELRKTEIGGTTYEVIWTGKPFPDNSSPFQDVRWDGEAWLMHAYSTQNDGYHLYAQRVDDSGQVILPLTEYGLSADISGTELQRQMVNDPISGRAFDFEATFGPPRINGHDRQGKTLPGLPRILTPPDGMTKWQDTLQVAHHVSPGGLWVAFLHETITDTDNGVIYKTVTLVRKLDLDGGEVGPLLELPTVSGSHQVLSLPDGTAIVANWNGMKLEAFRFSDKVEPFGTFVEKKSSPPSPHLLFDMLLELIDGEVWMTALWEDAPSNYYYRVLKLKPGCIYPEPGDANYPPPDAP